MWVVKRATSLFNSFCSNVAKQVARFCCRFTLPLVLVLPTFFTLCFTSYGDCTALQNQDNTVPSDCLSTALNYTLFFFKGQTGPRGNRGVSGGQGSMVSREQLP